MSFFDEDDEPPRTSRTRARPAPPPRRGRVTSGSSNDAQTLLARRAIAGVVGLILLLLLFFLVRSCNNTRHDNALSEYNLQVGGIATASRQTGDELFQQLNDASSQSPSALYQAILGHKNQAQKALEQAEGFSVPGDMVDAQQSLLIALQFRRDALNQIAAQIRPALGDEGEAADQAITKIASEMRRLDASDVLYAGRVNPFIKAALNKSGVEGQKIESSPFLNEISWVSPAFVASKLGQQLSSPGSTDGDGGTADPNRTTGPGLHGTGLNGTSYGNVNLAPGVSNRLTYVKGQPFMVSFTNQGENEEFNIKVTLKISRASGSPITLQKTVPQLAKGEKATVELPLNREPPVGTALTIDVNVNKVPGEKTAANNKATYPSLFAQG